MPLTTVSKTSKAQTKRPDPSISLKEGAVVSSPTMRHEPFSATGSQP